MKTLSNFKFISRIRPNQLVPFLFIFIGLIGAANHALWRDEMQGWLVAWRSDTWVDLWRNNAPSGHPILWSALIYSIKDLTGTPLSMQLLHWVLGSSAILVFWRWNPMPTLHKTLFTFGYFPFWEYFLVSRQYVLAELLTFIFCSSFPLRRRTYLPAAICIGLLTNTHAFSWAIAFAIGMALFLEWCLSPYQRSSYRRNKLWKVDLLISIIVILFLVGFAAFSLLQVSDSVNTLNSVLDLRHLFRVFGRIFGSYFLVIPNHNRWIDLIICGLITTFVLNITLSFLRRSKVALSFFLCGISSLFLFNYFIFIGAGSRHYGYYFLILISAIWLVFHDLEENQINTSNIIDLNQSVDKTNHFFSLLLTFSLSIHFVAGIHRTLYDLYLPYSAGKATAQYIEQKGWDQAEIFASRDVEVSTIAGYLDRDLFYPEIQGLGSYTQWDKRKSLSREETLDQLKLYFEKNSSINRVLLVLSRRSSFRELQEGEEMLDGSIRVVADKSFERSWTHPEKYYLYWAERVK
ncbi:MULTISPECIES: hypothetical protein [Prochlorococcus]|uniref:hypothetical protein n=1 Tax=Prochlorococcus TaxID=1218 RepID=UPI000533BA27|nr:MULTISPECIES: hypothetical protein [Prochlorococcus]KGG11900.1 hypothetical protein EV05_1101 [Prochlorococcus sp. MIT 0601]